MTTMATETDQPTPDAAASLKSTKVAPALGVLLAGVLMLSACSDSPDGGGQAGSEEPSESVSSSTSPSESAPDDAEEGSGSEPASSREPTEVAGEDDSDGDADAPVAASSEGPAQNWPKPPLPDEAREQSKAGAEAALTHWWEMVEYAKLTLKPDAIASHSTDDCLGCAKQAASVAAAVDEDVWYTDVDIEVDRVALTQKANDRYTGGVIVDSGAFEVFTEEGHYQTTPASNDQPWATEVIYQNGRWKVSGLELSNGDDKEPS